MKKGKARGTLVNKCSHLESRERGGTRFIDEFFNGITALSPSRATRFEGRLRAKGGRPAICVQSQAQRKPHADLAGGAYVFQLISASCGGCCLQIGVDLGPFSRLRRRLAQACSDACGMAKGCWEPKASTVTGYAWFIWRKADLSVSTRRGPPCGSVWIQLLLEMIDPNKS